MKKSLIFLTALLCGACSIQPMLGMIPAQTSRVGSIKKRNAQKISASPQETVVLQDNLLELHSILNERDHRLNEHQRYDTKRKLFNHKYILSDSMNRFFGATIKKFLLLKNVYPIGTYDVLLRNIHIDHEKMAEHTQEIDSILAQIGELPSYVNIEDLSTDNGHFKDLLRKSHYFLSKDVNVKMITLFGVSLGAWNKTSAEKIASFLELQERLEHTNRKMRITVDRNFYHKDSVQE